MAGRFFVGEYERQLDPKGRVALPSDFRPRFEPVCYLTMGEDLCVTVLTADDFEADTEATLARRARGEISNDELRAKAARTVEVKVDAQGRINVPDKLRSFAHLSLESPVIVAGAYDRLEIWHPERFNAVESSGADKFAGTTVGAPA